MTCFEGVVAMQIARFGCIDTTVWRRDTCLQTGCSSAKRGERWASLALTPAKRYFPRRQFPAVRAPATSVPPQPEPLLRQFPRSPSPCGVSSPQPELPAAPADHGAGFPHSAVTVQRYTPRRRLLQRRLRQFVSLGHRQ